MAPTASDTTDSRHCTRLADLGSERLDRILTRAGDLKQHPVGDALRGRTAGMLFFRGSLRTRTSFEVALHQLGAHSINLSATSDFWELEEREGTVMDGRAKEHVRDAAAVLSRYVDALAIRPAPEGQSWDVDRKDAQIHSWCRHATVPVINMESALWHPLQALADLLTLRETFGNLAGKRLALVWTHSTEAATPSVAHSLLHAVVRQGMNVSIAHPPGYELDEKVVSDASRVAGEHSAEVRTGLDRNEAVDGADIVYARSWFSLSDYGNATLAASHRSRHREWNIDEKLMARARSPHFMHAMPIRRNLEVTDPVLDSPASLVYEQAGNRLPTQKALLLDLLGG